ncbi:MAG: BrnA antitoxin family protein [Paracoccus sp. (in: a-proteobacteria)]|nr:BrnA antitoxin family protein [Paracoccus sp. (in: a-proteobacteria)]
MSKTVRYEVDLRNLPPLTDAQKAEIEALAAMSEDQIDTSDIPPLADAFWKSAIRNPFYKPTKTATTVRVDSDVLAWLKSQGKGYQTRMNAILRRAMLAEIERTNPHRK